MTRSRATAKKAGSAFERVIADALALHVDDRVDRRVRNGSKDRGDIGGVRLSPALRGGRVVIEVKDYGGRLKVGPWLTETDLERRNDDAAIGAIVAKRRGHANPLDQIVLMSLADFVGLLTGERPTEGETP